MIPQDLLNFQNKVVIVTGSGQGIGAGIALRFAQAGAKVVVHYQRSAEGAKAVAAQIQTQGGAASVVQGDLTQAAAVNNLIAQAVSAFGQVDVLVNNAGIYPLAPLLEMSESEWDTVVDSNLRSTFLCTQAVAQQMIAQGEGGAIVNIASIEAVHPAAAHSHYNAAKAGVVMYTKSAAFELGKQSIRVNCVSPGLIWREGIEQSWADGVKRYLAAAPLGRLGTAEEVADACLFLASSAARWITGVNLVVDGGVTARPIF